MAEESAAESPEVARQMRLQRAVEYGYINLNGAFVARNPRIRIFRKRALRLSVPEMIWIVLCTLAYAGLLAIFVTVMKHVPVLQDIVSWLVLILAPFAGWPTGRKIAAASPYRRVSGEGLGEYLWTQTDRVIPAMLSIIGVRPIATSDVITRASGRSISTPVVEWIGTARAPLMPKYDPERRNTSQDVILLPSSVATGWAKEVTDQRNRKEFRR